MKQGSIRYQRLVKKRARTAYNMGYRVKDAEFVARFYRLPISDLEAALFKLEARDRWNKEATSPL